MMIIVIIEQHIHIHMRRPYEVVDKRGGIYHSRRKKWPQG